MVLQTRRLLLRPWKKNKADAKALYHYAKDDRIGPRAGWPVHKDPAQSLEIIRKVLDTPDVYAITLRQSGGIVGAASLTYAGTGRKSLGPKEAEIGYWIGVAHWGMGYAPEAVEVLLQRAFTALGMYTVWCGYYEGNTQSRRVQEKCGFRYDHTDTHSWCEALHTCRVEHFTRMSREMYQSRYHQAESAEKN